MTETLPWSLVVTVSGEESIHRMNVLLSPGVDGACEVILKRGFGCAGKALNSGIAEAQNEIVVFSHQDICFPAGWRRELDRALAQLQEQDPNWGVLGVAGVRKGGASDIVAYCYSTGLQRVIGAPFAGPVEAQSLDEIILIIRKSAGLSFDEGLPGFHLYGTDICQLAKSRNLRSYVVQAFCIHNTNGTKALSKDFWEAYLYLRRKWWKDLPISTCCTKITRYCIPAVKQILDDAAHAILWPRKVGSRWEQVDQLRQWVERERLKYEELDLSEKWRSEKAG